MFEIITFATSAIAFPVLHLLNAWLFSFAELTPHVGLMYLPSFIRLFNVLVLGPIKGTLATFTGGLLLMLAGDAEGSLLDFLNAACSAASPLVGVLLFKWWFTRSAQISSLRDVVSLALIYCAANALLHHLMWTFFDPDQLVNPINMVWMALGDFNGALLGAYVLKWIATRSRLGRST